MRGDKHWQEPSALLIPPMMLNDLGECFPDAHRHNPCCSTEGSRQSKPVSSSSSSSCDTDASSCRRLGKKKARERLSPRARLRLRRTGMAGAVYLYMAHTGHGRFYRRGAYGGHSILMRVQFTLTSFGLSGARALASGFIPVPKHEYLITGEAGGIPRSGWAKSEDESTCATRASKTSISISSASPSLFPDTYTTLGVAVLPLSAQLQFMHATNGLEGVSCHEQAGGLAPHAASHVPTYHRPLTRSTHPYAPVVFPRLRIPALRARAGVPSRPPGARPPPDSPRKRNVPFRTAPPRTAARRRDVLRSTTSSIVTPRERPCAASIPAPCARERRSISGAEAWGVRRTQEKQHPRRHLDQMARPTPEKTARRRRSILAAQHPARFRLRWAAAERMRGAWGGERMRGIRMRPWAVLERRIGKCQRAGGQRMSSHEGQTSQVRDECLRAGGRVGAIVSLARRLLFFPCEHRVGGVSASSVRRATSLWLMCGSQGSRGLGPRAHSASSPLPILGEQWQGEHKSESNMQVTCIVVHACAGYARFRELGTPDEAHCGVV
ncbi:hypothetical protein FB451DRAFT_1376824 [Mycena latifolia]|nr:hypothetical protein FB451DRAFT_1376824 [Mycena latifolia]